MMKRTITALAASAALFGGSAAVAADCGKVRLGQVNWTGVSAKTETAAWMLNELGYETDLITASVPIMFKSLSSDERDAFLGLWLPTQRSMIQDNMKEGSIDIVAKNLRGAKYTVAVSKAAAEAGINNFEDLAENAEKFDSTIYGIEAGNDGNQIVKQLIEDDYKGMGAFDLQPSSEAGMLTEVQRRHDNDKWTAWLGWAPHPMNVNIDMAFLSGGADYWGPNKGGATVYSMVREGFAWQCPNVGQFLENYEYTVEEQATMASYVLNQDMDYAEAGRKLINERPELLERWLGEGGTYQTGPVTTADGESKALKTVKQAMDM
jgi:glycine betaine/proline transport system substrate-binding protein